jgi:hypothetical protein
MVKPPINGITLLSKNLLKKLLKEKGGSVLYLRYIMTVQTAYQIHDEFMNRYDGKRHIDAFFQDDS